MGALLLGKGAKSEDKELAMSIMAGEMRNAWQVEDRPNQPDTRPAAMRPCHKFTNSRTYVNHYDSVFRKEEDNGRKMQV